MKLTFLGTGTSTGIPQIRCHCPACTSTDPHDKRLRCSALVETAGRTLLIDCGPDFRQQMLRYHPEGGIDALLVTHHHYDHVGGTDDLRPYMPHGQGKTFPVYGNLAIEKDFRRRMPYCFSEPPYPGVPRFEMHTVEPFRPFNVCGVSVTPLPVNHYLIDINAYRIGRLGYVTDAKCIPQSTIEALKGVDTLVINALRHEPHISHLSLSETLEIVKRIKPRRTYLVHMSHDMGPEAEVKRLLPPGVEFAHDGMVIEIPD